MVPERLPDDAFQPVSAGCEPTVLLADRKSESWLVGAVWPVKNCKHFVAAAVGLLEDATEGGFVSKPASSSEAAVHIAARCCIFFRSFCGRKLTRPTV